MNELLKQKHINERISRFIKSNIDARGIRYSFVSQASGIEYQRLTRVLHGKTALKAAELLIICDLMDIKPFSLKELAENGLR